MQPLSFLIFVGFQIISRDNHIFCDLDRSRGAMLESLLAYPMPVTTQVLGQTLRTRQSSIKSGCFSPWGNGPIDFLPENLCGISIIALLIITAGLRSEA